MVRKRKRDESEPEVVTFGEALTNDVVELAKSSLAHTPAQAEKVKQFAIVLYRYMEEEMANAVVLAENAPVLQYYSCDGTPIRTQVRAKAIIGQKTIRREGKQTGEHLAQVGFLRYEDGAGRVISKTMYSPPIPMTQGKCPGHLRGG